MIHSVVTQTYMLAHSVHTVSLLLPVSKCTDAALAVWTSKQGMDEQIEQICPNKKR